MHYLILSIVAVALGPVLAFLAKKFNALSALDGFIITSIVGLVAIHIVPESTGHIGLWAIAFVLLGMVGPSLIERNLHKQAANVHRFTFWLAVFGLLVHALFDGIGLTQTRQSTDHIGSMLPFAVLLHRLPVGATLWWLLHKKIGAAKTIVVLVLLSVATALGYMSPSWSTQLNPTVISIVQALVAGSVLHVVLHQPLMPKEQNASEFRAGLGAIVGIAFVVILSALQSDSHQTMDHHNGSSFLNLCLESAPALLFAFGISGFVYMLLPKLSNRWLSGPTPSLESLKGVAFGLPLPICSCGVVPLYRTLVSQSVPATAAMAFLVATPELGIDALILSMPLLGIEMTIVRVSAAIVLALFIGIWVGRKAKTLGSAIKPSKAESSLSQSNMSTKDKITAAFKFGFGEIIDHTGPWLILGLVIASIIAPLLSGSWLAELPWGVDVVVFALLGLPAYVCASGATPLVAVLLAQGVSPGAGLAFLLAGPATNITTFGILTSLHGKKTAIHFAAIMALSAVTLGIAVNAIAKNWITFTIPMLNHHQHGIFAYACLAILAIAFAFSFLRQGPRGFIKQITSPFESLSEEDAHCCDH